jgi:hypothetical protein
MRNHWKTLAVTSVVAASALAATTLYADINHDGRGTMMGRGTMGMTDYCARMIDHSGPGKPNEPWRKEPRNEPKQPEKKG